jgi:hypothetical protein
MWIGMFRSTEEAVCAYDAAAWRFGRAQSELNFPDVESVEEAQFLAPRPLIEMREDQRNRERAVWHISIAEADERI